MTKEEFVELTVKIPKPLFEFLFDTEINIEEFIKRMVVEAVLANIEEMTPKILMDRYNLKPVFKEYGVLPKYYGDP